MPEAVSKARVAMLVPIVQARIVFRLGLCLCLVFLATCGGGEEDGGVVKVTFWHGMGGPLGRVLTSLIDEFNETHPDIEIESVSMGRYTALSQKIMAAVAAGKPPVMAQAYENWTIELIMSKSIIPIEEMIRGPNGLSQESLDDILPVFIRNNQWDGIIWSFPFNKSVRTLFYNKDLFEESGLDREHPPQNWDEYYGFSKTITKDFDNDGYPEIWGTAGQVNVWMFGNLLLQNGGSFLDETGQRVAFNSREGAEALAFMQKLIAGDVGFIASGYEYQNDFLANKVGMIEGSTVSLAFIRGKYDFELGIAPLPGRKQRGVTIAGTNVVVFSKTTQRERDAAWTFIKWFTDTEQTARWAAGTGYAPVRRSAFESEVLQAEFEQYPGLRDALGQLEYASFEPKIAGWYAGRRYLGERAIEAVLRGDADIQESLDRAADKGDAEIGRLKRLQKELGL
jgi:multiple sugar transport system substrate-binding protein